MYNLIEHIVSDAMEAMIILLAVWLGWLLIREVRHSVRRDGQKVWDR